MDVIHAQGLGKDYGTLRAVDGIDFTARRGERFGFLGPNGAGKSTTMRMLYCAVPVDRGALGILGHDARDPANRRAIKRRLGVVPQEESLDQDLTLRENLDGFARFHGLGGAEARRRVDELLDFADLRAKAEVKIPALSGGMKRRALIARGLVGDPDVLILDEPTTGLDPQARERLWDRLLALEERDKTLVLTTHSMDEAARLCDRLVVMDRGRIVAEGEPAALVRDHVPPCVVEVSLGEKEVFEEQAFGGLVERWRRRPDRVLLYGRDGEALMRRALELWPAQRAALRPSDLEDVFLVITGHGLEA